jgi:hypothetical protein
MVASSKSIHLKVVDLIRLSIVDLKNPMTENEKAKNTSCGIVLYVTARSRVQEREKNQKNNHHET